MFPLLISSLLVCLGTWAQWGKNSLQSKKGLSKAGLWRSTSVSYTTETHASRETWPLVGWGPAVLLLTSTRDISSAHGSLASYMGLKQTSHPSTGIGTWGWPWCGRHRHQKQPDTGLDLPLPLPLIRVHSGSTPSVFPPHFSSCFSTCGKKLLPTMWVYCEGSRQFLESSHLSKQLYQYQE